PASKIHGTRPSTRDRRRDDGHSRANSGPPRHAKPGKAVRRAAHDGSLPSAPGDGGSNHGISMPSRALGARARHCVLTPAQPPAHVLEPPPAEEMVTVTDKPPSL